LFNNSFLLQFSKILVFKKPLKEVITMKKLVITTLMLIGLHANGMSPPKNEEENTPLHLAAQSGNLEAVQLLINDGANPLARNMDNKTPVQLASDAEIKSYFMALFHEIRIQQAIKNLDHFSRR
jgi:ankyrin repeat protein